jgi:hypothetical protein
MRRALVVAGFAVFATVIVMSAVLDRSSGDRSAAAAAGAAGLVLGAVLVGLAQGRLFAPEQKPVGPLGWAIAGLSGAVLAGVVPTGQWDPGVAGAIGGALVAAAFYSPKLRNDSPYT